MCPQALPPLEFEGPPPLEGKEAALADVPGLGLGGAAAAAGAGSGSGSGSGSQEVKGAEEAKDSEDGPRFPGIDCRFFADIKQVNGTSLALHRAHSGYSCVLCLCSVHPEH